MDNSTAEETFEIFEQVQVKVIKYTHLRIGGQSLQPRRGQGEDHEITKIKLHDELQFLT